MRRQLGTDRSRVADPASERCVNLNNNRESDEAEQQRNGDSQHGTDPFAVRRLSPRRNIVETA
jgi:hypothetical protein